MISLSDATTNVLDKVLRGGIVDLNGRLIALSKIEVPVLIIAGESDGIAPARAVQPLLQLLSNAPEVLFEEMPGGHLGVLTGRRARETTWNLIDLFLETYATS